MSISPGLLRDQIAAAASANTRFAIGGEGRKQNLLQATRLRSVEALTGWLLRHMKLAAAQRLAIYALPVDQRLDVLLPQLG